MASCLEDTEEKSNGSKLSRLLIDGGTERLQKTFDGIHPPATLAAVLHAQQPSLAHLRHRRTINSSQWDKLFPPSGAAPDSKQFDITLLYILLRNICGLTPPSTGWNTLPLATDTTLEANLARVKFYRNEVYGHISNTEISTAMFEQYWREISGALVALGMDQVSIDNLKTSPLGTNDYLKLLEEWTVSDQTVKEVMEKTRRSSDEAKKAAESTKSEMSKTRKATEQLMRESKKARLVAGEAKKTGEEVKKLLMQSPQLKYNCNVLSKLARSNFTGHIKELIDHYQPGTRTWILSDIQEFVDSDQLQVLMITALPGVGKSVVAAIASQTMQQQGQLAACHFIDHGNPLRNNPRLIIQSIASHLCDSIPGFQQKLEEQLSRNVGKELSSMNCKELFALLLEEPLNQVQMSGKSKLVIIDALDECDSNRIEEFIKALECAPRLPKWLKFLVTTRPLRNRNLRIPLMKISINSENKNGANNLEDIKLYLTHHLQQLYPVAALDEMQAVALTLANATDGVFLIAYFVVDFAKERKPRLSQIHTYFPKGISLVYEEYFTRLVKDLTIEEDTICHFLEAIVAAKGPIPESLVLEILGLNESSRKRKKIARQALTRLSQLFVFEDKHVTVFHKSLMDWLTGAETEEHDFTVTVKDGHHVLAQHCLKYLQCVKQHESLPAALDDCERYALRYGFHHMLMAGGHEDQLRQCLTDLEILNAAQNTFFTFMFDLKGTLPQLLSSFCEPPLGLQYLINYFPPHVDFFDVRKFSHEVLQWATVLRSPSEVVPDGSTLFWQLNELQEQAVKLLSKPKYKEVLYTEATELECALPPQLKDVSDLQVSSSNKFAVCVGKVRDAKGREPRGQRLGLGDLDPDEELTMIMTCSVTSQKCLASVVVQKPCINVNLQCAISTDDRYVSVLNSSNYCELRDTHSLQHYKTLKADSKVLSSCFVQGGQHLIAGYKDGKIRVWDVGSGTVESTLDGHGEVMVCVASPCNGQALTVDCSGLLLLCQSPHHPQAISMTDRVTMPQIRNGTQAAFSPCGRRIAVAMCSSAIGRCGFDVYSTDHGKLLRLLTLNPCEIRPDICNFLAFVNDTHIMCGGSDEFCPEDATVVILLNIISGTKQIVTLPYGCGMPTCQTTERRIPELLGISNCIPDNPKLMRFKLHNIY